MFVGRWNPFHDGHKKLIKTVIDQKDLPVLIMVRDTQQDNNVYNRAERIAEWLKENDINGSVMIIPDIEGIYYGRDVGYRIEKIKLDQEIEKISGTELRKRCSECIYLTPVLNQKTYVCEYYDKEPELVKNCRHFEKIKET